MEAMEASSGLVLLLFVVVVVVMVVVVVVVMVVDTVDVDPGCSSLSAVEEVKKAETEEEACSCKLPGMIMLPLLLALPLSPLPLWLLPLGVPLLRNLPLLLEEDNPIVNPSCINVERVPERVAICCSCPCRSCCCLCCRSRCCHWCRSCCCCCRRVVSRTSSLSERLFD
jgi:hypothetical protein